MKLSKTLLFLFSLAVAFDLSAQNHYQFTQYNLNPLFMNPAQTGAYEGTYRVGGLYRSQWNSFSSNIYNPMTIYADAPLLMVAKRHWCGLGLMFASDKAGVHNLGTNQIALSGAFHYALDKRYRNVLSAGVQFGMGGRSISILSGDQFTSDFLNTGNDPRPDINAKSTSFADLSAGLLLKSTMNKNTKFSIGFNFAHIAKSKYTLLKTGGQKVKIPVYFAGIATLDRQLTKKLSIHPSLLYHTQSGVFTINPQVMMGYKMKKQGSKSDDILLKGGLGFDVKGNAANVLLGGEYKGITVGVGYDINTAALRKVAKDGIEIGVQYIGRIYKNPKVKPVMVCPKY